MCIALANVLAQKHTHDARDVFSDLFDELLKTRQLAEQSSSEPCAYSRRLTASLNKLSDKQYTDLCRLPRHRTYSRNVIGTQDNWIGFVCRWEPGVTSSVHGHPSFTYYQVLKGKIAMDLYEPINDVQARRISTRSMCAGDSIFSSAKSGHYDNLIHRVKNEQAPAYTLHFYSDNPAKGREFQAI